ncbi:MAG: hypothetical protein ACM3SV_13640 [Betaproteobacteria bacterium]
MTIHADLKEHIDRQFADDLEKPAELFQDALVVHLSNGVAVELRFSGQREYAINWRAGDAQLRIDTAPLHPELASFPNHLHDANGSIRFDPVTQIERAPWDNACALIEMLLKNPLLNP